MKKQLIIYLSLLNCALALCQDTICGTLPNTVYNSSTPPSTVCSQFLNDLMPKRSEQPLVIDLNFNIMQPNAGDSGVWANSDSSTAIYLLWQAQILLDSLELPYNNFSSNPHIYNSKIQFRVNRFRYIVDSIGYFNADSVIELNSGSTTFTVPYLYHNYKLPHGLNLFFVYQSPGIEAGAKNTGHNQVYFSLKTPATIAGMRQDLIHEIGHELGLTHTRNLPGEMYSNISPSLVCCPVIPQVDTQLQSASEFEQQNCTVTPMPTGISNNFMSYSGSCRKYFSPHQLSIMHFTARTNHLDAIAVSNYSSATSSHALFNDTVSQTLEVWNTDRFMKGNVIIPAGKTLSITCGVHMQHNGYFHVKPGGRLVVDGGRITNLANRDWQGIYVEGNPNLSQSFNHSTGLYTNQGYVWLNNAIIEYADIGVCNYGPSGISFASTGGVIKAENTSFLNNRVDVQFHPYLASNNDDESEFLGCNFITNDLVREMKQPEIHLNIWACNNIQIDVCSFQNNAQYHHPHKGLGIWSTDAIYSVTGNPMLNPSLFKGLEKGIAAYNMGALSSINVYKAKFIDNIWSIELTKANTSQITECDFKLDTFQTGVHIVNSKHWLIENNRFHGVAGRGIWATSNGDGNHRIYKNFFDTIPTGIIIQYNNSGLYNITDGLKINCNKFSLTYRDVVMLGTTGNAANDFSSASVNAEQGVVSDPNSPDPFKLVRNVYGATCSSQNKWSVNGSLTKLIQHGNNSDAVCQVTPQPACSNSLLVVTVAQRTLDFNNHCQDNGLRKASSTCVCSRCCLKTQIDGGISDTRGELNALMAHKDSVIDGGNTANLLNELATFSLSQAGMHDLLLSYSPYLSDTVLKAYFSSPSTSHAYFGKLHAANAPVEGTVLSTILSNALPQQVIDSIETQQSERAYSQREALDKLIVDARFNLHALYSEKLNYFLHDTLIDSKDSLVPFIRNNMSEMGAYYELLPEAYMKSGYKLRAIALADSLAATDTYSTNLQLLTKKLRMDTLFSSGTFFNPIDSVYFEGLNTDTSLVGCWESRALFNRLHNRNMRFFFLEIEEGSDARKARPDEISEIEKIKVTNALIKIYPNPNQGQFIIECPETTSSSDYLLTDILGRTIQSGAITNGKHVLNVAYLPNGIYTLRILSELNQNYGYKIIVQK